MLRVPFVDLSRMHLPIQGEISNAINQVIASGSFISGKFVAQFEEAFAAYVGVQHCIGCANGTDALELAFEALDIGEGDEVIVPVHTWISTASAVKRVGATPVFADVHPETYCINPSEIALKITPKTKAIVPVHLYGHPCQMDEIMQLAQAHNLLVVEDCAQAHGATYKGRKVGSFGNAACFSFYPSKNLGALGDGGCVLTNNESLAQTIRELNNCGQRGKNNIERIARNSRLDALQAAVLNVKLNFLDEWNESRRVVAEKYAKFFHRVPDIKVPVELDECKHVYHLYVVQADERSVITDKLNALQVEWGNHYPFLLNEVFNCQSSYPVATAYRGKILSLPMYPFLKDDEIEYVATTVAEMVSVNQ